MSESARLAARPDDAGRACATRRRKIFATLFALLLAAVWIGPLALMVMTSIKPNSEFLNGPFALPKSPTFEPYRQGLERPQFRRAAAEQRALRDDRFGAGGAARARAGVRAEPVRAAGQEIHLRA